MKRNLVGNLKKIRNPAGNLKKKNLIGNLNYRGWWATATTPDNTRQQPTTADNSRQQATQPGTDYVRETPKEQILTSLGDLVIETLYISL